MPMDRWKVTLETLSFHLQWDQVLTPPILHFLTLTLGGPSPLLKEQASSILHSILGKGFPGSLSAYQLTYNLQVIPTLSGLLPSVKVHKEQGGLVVVTVG